MSALARAGILLALLVALSVGMFWRGYQSGVAAEKTRFDEHLAADDRAAKLVEVDARKREFEWALAANAAAQSYEQGKHDAESNAASLLSDLRTGTVRLQNRWAGCEAQRRAEAAGVARQRDAAATDRQESASRIVRAADECDAQVRGLQEILMSERVGQGTRL
jgi:hypothetical protein